MAMETTSEESGHESLQRLRATDPTVWLAPSPSLSQIARTASEHLFTSLRPFTPKTPFEKLLTQGFDAEQIWQQIDLQAHPLLSTIRRDVKQFEKNPGEISKLKKVLEVEKKESKGGRSVVEEENGFLKIKELEEFLEEGEAREYGLKKKDKKEVKKVDGLDFGHGDDEDADKLASYGDFFGAKKKKVAKQKSKLKDGSEESDMEDEQEDDEAFENKTQETVSTHEKELENLRSKIEQMEKANLDPKAWTMQGEVTAAKRPLNSALEVDLDFEHNARPAPVITEEVTATLEDLIKKRILEGQFDDVRKAPVLPSKAPREVKELDENKSKKSLAEIYEEEYVQKTNLASAPMTLKDKQKQEASMLFKKLSLKLDALSHFHFAPKPVIEDMSIEVNVPALAMEEIAPVAVSDAAMLAPEEVFSGKGDIKEEAELTQAERKRRRAKKKRKFKAEAARRTAKKPRDNPSLNHDHDKEGNEILHTSKKLQGAP
ncbi:hypothetical protein FH972_019150 [Carpinus fangiana]|uniref:Uncharacterized protein n=1 Tax=Carpinus fangiana TaxID=176857 RepID=A0A5N6RPE1_9ROSI|nr:hypothetical protein FH972_019150 [Carpinus fangiana]